MHRNNCRGFKKKWIVFFFKKRYKSKLFGSTHYPRVGYKIIHVYRWSFPSCSTFSMQKKKNRKTRSEITILNVQRDPVSRSTCVVTTEKYWRDRLNVKLYVPGTRMRCTNENSRIRRGKCRKPFRHLRAYVLAHLLRRPVWFRIVPKRLRGWPTCSFT